MDSKSRRALLLGTAANDDPTLVAAARAMVPSHRATMFGNGDFALSNRLLAAARNHEDAAFVRSGATYLRLTSGNFATGLSKAAKSLGSRWRTGHALTFKDRLAEMGAIVPDVPAEARDVGVLTETLRQSGQ